MFLEGLLIEFKSIVTLISTKHDWFECDEIESPLHAHENRVTKQTKVLNVVSTLNPAQTLATATVSAQTPQ